MRVAALAALAIALACAACTDEPDDAELPTCEELGADPEQSLFCNTAGVCTFEGEQCRRQGPDGGVSE